MKKVTVMQFITGLSPGGAEKMMIKTVGQLNKKKYNIIICSLLGGALEKDVSKEYPVFVLNKSSLFSMPSAIRELRRIIKREKVDIVHSYLYHANIVSRFAARKTKAKVISSIRVKEIKKHSHNIIDGFTSGLVDKYTTVAENVRKWLIEKERINPKKIITIPNGLDFSKFKVTVNKEKKRRQLKIPKGSNILISVANLRKQKDYPTLFKAMKILLQNKPNTHLLVAGIGEAEKEYKQCAKDEGIYKNVHFLGFRRDVFELIELSDICVLSTFYEGMSNALLEYMALKKPIVATAIEENEEVINDRKEGLLIPEESPHLMAKAIIELIENKKLREQLGKNAYTLVKEKHDIKRVAKQTEQLYERLLR